jgi:acyl-CoA thioesterase
MAIEPLPAPAAHPFERATAVVAEGPGRWRAQLDPDWFGSVAPHGGHLAAQLLRAMVAEVDNPALTARSLTVHFLTAGAPGPFTTEVRIERAGRSLSALSARAVQNGETLAVAMAALGRPRRGPAINAATRRVIPAPGELRGPSQSARTRLPPVMGHYEMRYAFGAPRTGEEPASGGWVRPRLPLAPSDVLSTALSDTWMPSVYVALAQPEMTTTVELTVNFLASPEGLAPDGWYQVGFWTPAAGEGYFREEGEIWGADGRPLARCSQLAVFLGGRVPRRFAHDPD